MVWFEVWSAVCLSGLWSDVVWSVVWSMALSMALSVTRCAAMSVIFLAWSPDAYRTVVVAGIFK